MAAAGMFAAADLEPLLHDRGIRLSSVQVWRLVTQTPERLSPPALAALCDIFDCTPAQLIATRAENAASRKTATDDAGVIEPPTALRPKRARICPEA
ncbi:helix-turn-helix transcriptional regulator [Nonomuraea angiospora]|uniref:helix-turn-helix domain-containing protein n=1 Tax=Nonomuraea angiospora TaxID=46172 RepID=UPI0033EDB6B6